MMNNTTNRTPDKDSMMALEALLKIRSYSIAEPSSPQAASAFSLARRTPSVMNLAQHFIPMPVLSAITAPPMASFATVPHAANIPASAGVVVEKKAPAVRILSTTPPLTNATEQDRMRQDKINAALRSKPQRGRKRENLSVMERLELTRTRNREHAKSTRVRKKARYQELVDKEIMYDDLKIAADVDEARVDAVMSFVDCREKLLCSSTTTGTEALNSTLYDRSSFTFDVQGPLVAPAPADAMTRMETMEEVIRCKVANHFGKDAASKLGYSVVGGRDSIAINKAGVAMVELAVVVKNNSTQHADASTTIMSAMIRWKFAPNAAKLMGMQWTTMIDTLAHVHPTDRSKLLGSQTCYPSVVSLDHGALSPSAVEQVDKSPRSSPHTEEGPGMNI